MFKKKLMCCGENSQFPDKRDQNECADKAILPLYALKKKNSSLIYRSNIIDSTRKSQINAPSLPSSTYMSTIIYSLLLNRKEDSSYTSALSKKQHRTRLSSLITDSQT